MERAARVIYWGAPRAPLKLPPMRKGEAKEREGRSCAALLHGPWTGLETRLASPLGLGLASGPRGDLQPGQGDLCTNVTVSRHPRFWPNLPLLIEENQAHTVGQGASPGHGCEQSLQIPQFPGSARRPSVTPFVP